MAAAEAMAHAKHEEQSTGHHFLVVAYGIQGHINPARTLARRLARIGGCNVTVSIPVSGHRRLFPFSDDGKEASDGFVSYIPFSDGKDDGSWPKDAQDRAQRREANFRSLSALVSSLAAAGGRGPVTCIVCTFSMPVVGDVARVHGIPLAVYWIQPATALATYYHYFHGHGELIAQQAVTDSPTCEVTLPGLHPLRISDMPTFFTEKKQELSKMILQALQELFEQMDREKPMVLVNTFGALEDAALKAIQPYIDVFAVGPAVVVPPPASPAPLGADAQQSQRRRQNEEEEEARIHLFKHDQENYLEWLNGQPEKSVVYLSFGSLLTYTKRQAEEILQGLQACRRPYLWVLRRDQGRADQEVDACLLQLGERNGVVVEWCDQLQVLSHPSVGCFVTHCGWNSTLEAIAFGVPMVAAPSWSDQPLNAHLIQHQWGVGVRAERDAEGILTSTELLRCVELVMGENETATKIKENATRLKEGAQDAVATDGPLERSIRSFIKRIPRQHHRYGTLK